MKVRHYSYLAGMLDGDGCIAAGKTFRSRSNCYEYSLKLEITSVKRKTIDRLIELFGGIPCKSWVDGELYWKWVCQVRENQRWVLEGTIPYMVLKQKQAKLALEFVNLGRKENPSERDRLVAAIQRLNNNPIPETPSKITEKSVFGYTAGMIDAEGTLSISKQGTSTSQIISVANDSEFIMKFLNQRVGGSYCLSTAPGHFVWNFFGTCKEKETFLLAIAPYLVTKKEQATILLEYVRMNKKKNPARRQELLRKIQSLNHRTSEANTPDTLVV